MKNACMITMIFVLTATIFAGCRNTGNTTTTTKIPSTSSSARPTIIPMPEIPLPTGTNTTSPNQPESTGVTNGTAAPNGTEMPQRSLRPSRRPRY